MARLVRLLFVALLPVLVAGASVASAQNNNGNNNNNNNNAGGILIDARGLVAPAALSDKPFALEKKRLAALAVKALPGDLNTPSQSRKVSLKRWEAACRAGGKPAGELAPELFYSAGLQQIDHVFLDPDQGDIVIAGPAGGFAPDANGCMVSVESGRPVLRFDDWVVLLRTLARESQVGCSIDPVPERLSQLNQFVQQNSAAASPAVVQRRYAEMARVLGAQNVRFDGVPEDSHAAIVLLAADYRMKRLSMGLENPRVKGLRSHLAMLAPGGNSVQRWWFVPFYESIERDAAFESVALKGPRVQLLSQEELTNAAGQRSDAATTRLSTQAYAKQFSERYGELAAASTTFAELQNLVDWTLVAALANDGRRWSGTVPFAGLRDDALTLPTFAAPKQVQSVANWKRSSTGVMLGLIGGGVTIRPQEVLRERATVSESGERLSSLRRDELAQPPTSSADAAPWWWD